MAAGAEIAVMTRDESGRKLARKLGAGFVGGTVDRPPRRLDAAIIFAPAGEIVPAALEATTPGGTVVLAGIHMSDIPSMSYADHLFGERDLRTVTANTRGDGEAFLRLARNLQIVPPFTPSLSPGQISPSDGSERRKPRIDRPYLLRRITGHGMRRQRCHPCSITLRGPCRTGGQRRPTAGVVSASESDSPH